MTDEGDKAREMHWRTGNQWEIGTFEDGAEEGVAMITREA